MKSNHSDLAQRYMILIKIDAHNLAARIRERHDEFINSFSIKRDRAIFKDVFFSRYQKATVFDLSHLPIEVIEVVDDFYQAVDTLYWYLMHTQDMPNTVEDEVYRYAHILEGKFENLRLYIDAELTGRPLLADEEIEAFSEEHLI